MRTHKALGSVILAALIVTLGSGACSKSPAEGESANGQNHAPAGARSRNRTAGEHGGTGAASFGGAPAKTAVPVEVATVEKRSISFFIQSSGTLEAENEVDIVARTQGPIEELRTEEGRVVSKGQLLARIEDDEIRAQVEIGRVSLEETRLTFERAERLYGEQLLSPEDYEQAKSRFETAQAQYSGDQLQLSYTEIRAPFGGTIVARLIDAGQQVSAGSRLFRISDFDPLLCPVQIPERELPRLVMGQSAYLTVAAWPDERFDAKVLRISPVVDAASGTVKVTLDVSAKNKLRPGMFARVFLETDTHDNAIVMPKTALSLESLGDTVFVHRNGSAERRAVEIGFEEGDSVEILSGVMPGEQVVVVGQDGLSDGTPIQVLGGDRAGAEPKETVAALASKPNSSKGPAETGGDTSYGDGPGRRSRPGAAAMPDPSQMSSQDLERLRARMRSRGLSETEIEERIERMHSRGQRTPSPTQR